MSLKLKGFQEGGAVSISKEGGKEGKRGPFRETVEKKKTSEIGSLTNFFNRAKLSSQNACKIRKRRRKKTLRICGVKGKIT